MGLIYSDIELINSDDLALVRRDYLQEDKVRKMKVSVLVDTGAMMLSVNETIKIQLGLPVLDRQMGELADGSRQSFEIVGPVDIRFANRQTTVRAVVLPGDAEPLLGSIPMEDMDVLIEPRSQKLIVNPSSPYMAKKSLK
ncbi:MAG: clan AA aspartic protease [Deltaproteobacteria bacterium]|nr:MAG: clan AA aspartic protease [Deltaproteobacteria bacterium]